MSNSTEEYWDINGTSLNQFCWNIVSIGGSRYSVPPKRGDNIKYPNKNGRVFRPKKADSRIITLQMWTIGISQNDVYVSDQELQFNDNWQALRNLLFSLEDELTLTRRWRTTIGGVPTVTTASAKCELSSNLDLTMTGRTRGTFSVDLLLPDPFFYGSEITTNFDPGDTLVVNNPGDVSAYQNMSIRFDGELWGPALRNTTKEPEIYVQANTLVQPSTHLDLDVTNFDAFRSYDNANITGAVIHRGSKPWFALWPGDNTVKFESTGVSSGSATLKFKPAYL